MNLIYGRNSDELSTLDRMSNALLMQRHMHGAVGHSGHMHLGEAIRAGATSAARVAVETGTAAVNNGGWFTIFGVAITDELVFWLLMANLVFMSLLVFVLTLNTLGVLPSFPGCGRNEGGYENIDDDSGDGDYVKDIKVVVSVVGDGEKKGTTTVGDEEHEMLLPPKAGDAA